MKTEETGIFQEENGLWYYRFSMMINGEKRNFKSRVDENGNRLTSKKQTIRAKLLAIEKAKQEASQTINPVKIVRKTYAQVFEEYQEKGRSSKAFETKRKQDSLWKNHLKESFGNRYVDEVSVAEINDFLSDLYYIDGYSYQYVESFLKMFYLICGQAYSRNYLDHDTYNKLCLNKGTKISMPKMKVDEDTDIVSFSKKEIKKLDAYFQGTNGETAYMLGRYCGLRINECYGLKWENVDLVNGTILIDRQMQYQDSIIKLKPLKTRNAKRTIVMCSKLKVYFQNLFLCRERDATQRAKVRNQKQTFLEDIDGSTISSLDLVNSLPDGKIQTVNSMKYHSQLIKSTLKIEFKYHYLRHTFGTFLADLNTPAHLLCKQMGHGNIQVTQKYYIAFSENGFDVLQHNLNKI